MKATIDQSEKRNAINYGGDKELIRSLNAVVSHKGKLKEVVTLRFYMGRSRNAQTVYASVWVSGKCFYASGTGKASGWGYCKRSASASEAFKSAGITFDSPVGGRGMSVVHEAIGETVRALGYRGQLLIVEN